MTAEQQLERSVLERKERDELTAIAQAMSLKTTTRTKKADIIDQILTATGVTPGEANGNGDAAAKPAPRRSRPAAAKQRRRRRLTSAVDARRPTLRRHGITRHRAERQTGPNQTDGG